MSLQGCDCWRQPAARHLAGHRGAVDADGKIPYRETIKGSTKVQGRHKKQSGGAGQFGEVYLRIEPLERGGGFEFVDKIVGGVIPKGFLPAIEKGIKDIMRQGIAAGYPVEDLRVTVYDGKTHSVDSKEIAFKMAGKLAFKDAFQKARPTILEPVVNVEVTTPGSSLGAITGDLSSRRGKVFGTDTLGSGTTVVKASVPLAEVIEYEPDMIIIYSGNNEFLENTATDDGGGADRRSRRARSDARLAAPRGRCGVAGPASVP